jgi:hypothetical protein
MCNISHNSIVLIVLSNGLELLNDGHTLTSSNQGFNFSSSKISKPYSSKQTFLFLVYFILVTICGSTDNKVLIITSFILSNTYTKSIPSLSYSFLSYFKHHLDEFCGSSISASVNLLFLLGT